MAFLSVITTTGFGVSVTKRFVMASINVTKVKMNRTAVGESDVLIFLRRYVALICTKSSFDMSSL